MPQNPFIIATKTTVGDAFIFDYTKHPSQPATPDEKCVPELRLEAAVDHGFGLAWNPLKQGFLASTSGDSVILLWDVNQGSKERRTLPPVLVLRGHTDIVEDVAWHASDEHILASVSDDRTLSM